MNYNAAINRLDVPARMLKLPIDERGFPVPRFVDYIGGKPDFRAIRRDWLALCVRHKFCWLCGEKLGRNMAFVIGPMCAINRVNSEPPSHLECARFACKACPFLTQPRRARNEHDLPDHVKAPGVALDRNPGVALVWVTTSYRTFEAKLGTAGLMFALGDPVKLEWYAHGRTATRAEIMESINSGLPLLRAMAARDNAMEELEGYIKRGLALVPNE
jgi:hypothetical protein